MPGQSGDQATHSGRTRSSSYNQQVKRHLNTHTKRQAYKKTVESSQRANQATSIQGDIQSTQQAYQAASIQGFYNQQVNRHLSTHIEQQSAQTTSSGQTRSSTYETSDSNSNRSREISKPRRVQA